MSSFHSTQFDCYIAVQDSVLPEFSTKWDKALYWNIPCTCLIIDLEGNILAINDCGASDLGYSPEELVNKPLFALFHEIHAQRLEAAVRSLWEESLVWEGEWKFLLCSASELPKWVRISAKKIENIVLLVFEDVSQCEDVQLKASEIQIKLASPKEEIYKNYLNNRLQERIGNIKIASSLITQILDKKELKEKASTYLKILSSECDRVIKILDEFL